MNKAIGIMGGTFDPIHYGHLVTAEAARYGYKLDKVIFVPSGRPPHKKERQITAAEHRYNMTELAVKSNPYFQISRVELDRPGYSYAIDTMSQFVEQYGSDAELYFITGADAILEIITWKNVDKLMEYCQFIAATRPGFHLDDLHQLPDKFIRKIIFMEVPALAISSSDIRRRVAEHRPIKYLLPEPVENYIYQHDLYREVYSSSPGK
ncbi:nicotinate-nucleotide adenylyltransferase [Dehalobacterium formicoaceticum]|uniref:Probable nicotinate-nucleotide adenylyltransferase n=1 Tax=Dehalobacterium formicoaceticum TaxID=51515 RepID=A0ABT1Y350_9FIRM|nr:nicotinate-nucleotide adenylyltransferase [Dehalobacterium formicoaceticum]MCR6544988.1 nicotinate-nucleotide adenylyltransferase [Dehalobacterium formicoaceticum]